MVAVTVNEYETPFVRPETVHELVEEEQVFKPGYEVTVNAVIDKPPLETGAVHDTTDEPVEFVDVSSVAETPVGASGGPVGVTEFDSADATPVPAEFVAVTVNL